MKKKFTAIASITHIVLLFLSKVVVGKSIVKNWSDSVNITQQFSPSVRSTGTTTKCNGTPRERRQLASLGNSTTDKQWEQMGACVAKREKTLSAIFSLHVSKAGGKFRSSSLPENLE